MSTNEKLALMKERFNKLVNSPKNIKSAGALKKLKRRIRNLENSL